MTQQKAMANMMPLGAKNFAEILVGAIANDPAFMKGVNMVAPGGAGDAKADSTAAAEKVEEAPKEEKKPEVIFFLFFHSLFFFLFIIKLNVFEKKIYNFFY
jgi:ribosomal protein L12E/L44/L45/RPP1/RPP2